MTERYKNREAKSLSDMVDELLALPPEQVSIRDILELLKYFAWDIERLEENE